jgi:hypothetical protein
MASREEKQFIYTDVIRFICNLVNLYKVLIRMDLNFINVC